MYCKECGQQIEDDSKFCQSCGTQQENGELETKLDKVDTSNKLEKLLINARRAKECDNIEQAKKYYSMVLMEYPENWEAFFYDTYFGAMQCSVAEILPSANRVAKCIKSVLMLIKKIDDTNKQNEAIKQINTDLNKISLMLHNAAGNHYNEYDLELIQINPELAEEYAQECSDSVLNSAYILLTFGDELISQFGKSEFTIPIIIQCYKIALDHLYKAFDAKYIDSMVLQKYTDKLKEVDPYKLEKSENKLKEVDHPKIEKSENKTKIIFADIESEQNNEGSFLTKPLAPEGVGCMGCGCLPAFVTTPIFIAIPILLIIFFVVLDSTQTPAQKEMKQKQLNIKEQTIKARVILEQEIKQNLRDPKSYEHVSTEDRVVNEYLYYVKITFRSNNAFGGKVLSTVVAEFNLNTKPMEWKIISGRVQ